MLYPPSLGAGDLHRLGGGGRKMALQWGATQKGLLLFSSPRSPAEPSFMQTTLLKKLEIQATREMVGVGVGGQQFIKWQQASEVGTAGMEAERGEGTLALKPVEAKYSILPRTPAPQQASQVEPGRRVSLHLPPRAGLEAQRCSPRCWPGKHGWLEHPRARGAGAFPGVCGRRPLRERSEVGNLNARAGSKCGAFQPLPGAAPSSRPPWPFPLFAVFPASPIPLAALPPSSLPDPRPSPAAAAAVTSKPKDKTRPPAGARLPAGPERPPRSASVTGGAQARARPPPASSPRV